MLNKLALVLANRMLNNKIISKDRFEIYVYGLELLISFLFSTSIIICLGLIFHKILETVAFLIVFIILRSFTGGYHAKTYAMCTILTLGTFILVLTISSFTPINILAYLILFFIGIVILAIFSPIEHPNKTLTITQKKRSKIISICLFVVFTASGACLRYINITISSTIFFSLIADFILMLVKIKKKGE